MALTRFRLRVKLTCYKLPGHDDANWNNILDDIFSGGGCRQKCCRARWACGYIAKAGPGASRCCNYQGITDVAGFVSAEVAFTYAGDTTGTWFLIATSNQPVNLDTLATWDTTTITDGDYILRVRVYLKDGSSLDVPVPNLRVRNYTPVETPTPAPTAILPTATPIPTLTATPFPSPTPLPTNPAILTPADVSKSIAYGGLGAVFFLIVIGVYLGLRRR